MALKAYAKLHLLITETLISVLCSALQCANFAVGMTVTRHPVCTAPDSRFQTPDSRLLSDCTLVGVLILGHVNVGSRCFRAYVGCW